MIKLSRYTKKSAERYVPRFLMILFFTFGKIYLRRLNYNFGPAETKALPASLPVNLAKFFWKRAAKSLAFSSH